MILASPRRNEAELVGELNSDIVPIDPMRLCKEIADFVDDDMIVVGDL